MKGVRFVAAAAAALALAACEPVYEGPQLSEVPEGLAYTTSIRTARLPLPDRRVLAQYAYASPGGTDWKTSVTISEYEGLATRAEVEAARETYHGRYGGRSSRYGPVEDFQVDGRPAWSWTDDSLFQGQVSRHGLVVVVPWDDRTFSVEVSSEEERWMDRGVQRRLAASFHVAKKGRYRLPLLALFVSAGVGWALYDRRRRRA